MIEQPQIPSDMREVTKDEFFAELHKKCSRHNDIMPKHNEPKYTIWSNQHRRVFGWSTPGWKHPGEWPKRYAIVK